MTRLHLIHGSCLLLAGVLIAIPPLQARNEGPRCGTRADRWHEETHLHRLSSSRSSNAANGAAASTARRRKGTDAVVRADRGDIAVIDDADGVVARRNPFNLSSKTLRFAPSSDGKSYRFELLNDMGFDEAEAGLGTVLAGMGDDDSRELPLPFSFPFFGERYGSVWVNSDGNVTFGAGDSAITDRSLGRFNSGIARIAAMFRDLDPSKAQTGIAAFVTADKAVISWMQVPEYRDFGTGPAQSFQVRLLRTGTIELAWASTTTDDAIVGITSGHLQDLPAVLSFTTAAGTEYRTSVAEKFSGREQIDIFSAAQKFFLSHEDAYDYLLIFNELDIEADDNAVAYEVTVRNNRTGYGDPAADSGHEAGSPRRLQAIVNMGPLAQYPKDPNSRVAARSSAGDTPLTILAHETGHLFLAYASVRDTDDPSARPMLDAQRAHWNFLFNSDASVLEGNRIQDNGQGASPRFQTVGVAEGFSALDQYLMGLRSADEVPDIFLVTNAKGSRISGLPRIGAAFDGERRDIRIDEIIQAEGRRIPDHTVAQRRFRFAFVLITAAGREPSGDAVTQVDAYRRAFEQFYDKATGGRASADTTLKRSVRLSTWPASGIINGGTAIATVELQEPAEAGLTIFLKSQNGSIQSPPAAMIAPGTKQVPFTIQGLRAGVDELIAEPRDPTYETVQARIQVSRVESVVLAVVGGDLQVARPGTPLPSPIRIRVTDANDLPYPGVLVNARVSDDGELDRASSVTDENGVAVFQWTPGSGRNELLASVAGGRPVRVMALGMPIIGVEGIVNAASFRAGLPLGGIATVFGSSLSAAEESTVLINDVQAPVLYSSPTQINFYVPADTALGNARVVVRTAIGTSNAAEVLVLPVQPGVFFDSNSGFGAIVGSGTGRITSVRPVARGEAVEIYCTGLGNIEPGLGGLFRTRALPQVMIAGAPAQVLFSGLAPGFPGLYQVNVVIPDAAPSGSQDVALVIGGISSNVTTLRIR